MSNDKDGYYNLAHFMTDYFSFNHSKEKSIWQVAGDQ